MSTHIKRTIEVLLVILVLSFSLVTFNPLASYIERVVEEKKTSLIYFLGDKTGISFDYSSISPSILKRILIKHIGLFDYQTKEKIGEIEFCEVEYNILSLIAGNFEDLIRHIKISNTHVKIDKKKNAKLIDKLTSLIKSDGKEKNNEKKNKDSFNFKLFFSELKPLEILIKNASFYITEENEDGSSYDANFDLSEAKLDVGYNASSFSINMAASYQKYNSKEKGDILQNISTSFVGEGELKKDFSSISCKGMVSGSHSDIGKMESLYLEGSYKDNEITLKNQNKGEKNNFKLVWNVKTKELRGDVRCIAFRPLSIFTPYRGKSEEYTRFASSLITTDSTFYFKNKDIWEFDSNFKLDLPSFSIKGFNVEKTYIRGHIVGKNGQLNILSLGISERRVDFSLRANYNLITQKSSGTLNISHLLLPTKKNLEASIFFNGSKHSYVVNAPYINIGEEKLEHINANVFLRGNQYDFNVSLEDDGGRYAFDGSLSLGKARFLELHITLDSVKAKSILTLAKSFTDKANNISPKIVAIIEDTQITTESYISTDFKNYSYNFVQVIFASISSDGFYTTFQVNGNNSSIAIDKFNFAFKKLDVTGKAQGYFESGGSALDAFFSINSIAYNISAIYVDNSLSIYGDYGITINMFLRDELLAGALVVRDLPLPIIDSIFSLDANFELLSLQKWSFECSLFKLSRGQEFSSNQGSYDIEMKGAGDQDKIFFDEIRLITNDLPLMGHLNAVFNSSETKRFNTDIELVLNNETTKESFTSQANFFLSDKFYFDGKITFLDIALMRFFKGQSIRNIVKADAIFLGSIDEFFIHLDLEKLNYTQNGKDIVANGVFFADEKMIRVQNCDATWMGQKIIDMEGHLSPFDAEGKLSLYYDGKIGLKPIKTELNLVYSGGNKSDLKKDSIFFALSNLYSNFSIEFLFSDIAYGGDFTLEKMKASLVKEPGVIAMSLGNSDEVYGVYLDDGTVSLHVDENLPIKCNVDGRITKEEIDLNCLDISIDMPLVWNLTPFIDKVTFESGKIVGDLKIGGTQKEPEFYSNLKCVGVSATSQYYAPELYGPTDIDVIFSGTTLTVPYTKVKGPSATLYGQVKSEFSGWIPNETVIECGVLEHMALMQTKTIAIHATGYVSGDLKITITPGEFYLVGDAIFDNGFFSIPFNDLHKFENKSKNASKMAFRTNLDIHLGKKAEYRWPNNELPILRALIPSEKPIQLAVDSSIGYVDIKGASTIRGGEVFYVKRNFYIREGNVAFVATPQGFEPLISVRAEIRDKDEGGEPIKIILTAKDQNLENFSPKIETFPPRSDAAVMQLLGQVFIGNVSKDNFLQTALTTATDLVAQMGVFKKTESKIRDFLHVDAFSVRTLLLQNAVFGNLFKPNTDTPLTIGNYFDNTSVYIGKYFGSQIYADALLHLDYYDPLLARSGLSRKPVYGNLLFMPELGLEMSTPFFLLRSSISPTRADTLFVSDSKLTFSWKFAY